MPKEVKLVGTADVHIPANNRAWLNRPIEGDALFSLQQIISLSRQYNAEAIAAAGDVIDKALVPSPALDVTFRELDWLLREPNKLFLYNRGQHEGGSDYVGLHAATRHLHRCSLQLPCGLTVYGIDYQPAGKLQQELVQVPAGTDILLLHQVWENLMGSVALPQGRWEQIINTELVLTGDFHEYVDEVVVCEDGHELRVISPGSTCLQAINEPPDKYVVLIYDDLSVEKIRLRTRQFHDYGLLFSEEAVGHFFDTLEGVLKRLQAAGQADCLPPELLTPILRIRYAWGLERVPQRISRAVAGRAHLFVSQEPRPKPESDERREIRRQTGAKHATTLDSKLQEYLRSQNQQHLLVSCQRLLASHDLSQELEHMRREAVYSDEVTDSC